MDWRKLPVLDLQAWVPSAGGPRIWLENPEPRNKVVQLALVIDQRGANLGWPIEGLVTFVSYLFRVWDYRKVYVEIFEFNMARLTSPMGRVLKIEGCLLDYEYHDGSYCISILGRYLETVGRDILRRVGGAGSAIVLSPSRGVSGADV